MKKLAIIDGKSVFYRGYYAMPNLSLQDGTPTGGVYGFVSLAFELVRKLNPDYVVVAWDKRGTNIRRRKEIFPGYKANRKPAPADFYEQMPLLFEVLDALNWPFYETDDYEADDIMGTLARQAESQGLETYLISSDLDMLQILDKHTRMYALKKGLSSIEEFCPDSFEEKYGVRIDQFLDLKSLKGDSSDNIPGVPGVGEKTAVQLLQKYGTLDQIYEQLDQITGATHTKLAAGKESAYMSRELAEIWFDAPVKLDLEAADVHNVDRPKLLAELKKLEFNSLIRRLPEAFSSGDDEQDQPEPEYVQPLEPSESFTAPDGTFVALDVKSLWHAVDADPNKQSERVFDIQQARFLLDPLGRKNWDNSSLAAAYTEAKHDLMAVPKLWSVAQKLDFPLIAVLYKMERRGVRIDPKFFARMDKELAHELDKITASIHKLAGREFNVASPAQLAEVLFTDLKLPTDGVKKTTRGYSTGAKELEKLRGSNPIIELIEQHRELSKLLGTYVGALPKLADADDRIHTTFTQNVTATGRLSSINPNLQNIPVRGDLGKKVRAGFVAAPGHVFVSADYSQFELRLAAVMADDQPLIDDFNAGVDIHTKTAADVFKVPASEVTKDQRRAAKVINFGVLYGMSPRGLSVATGMSMADAKEFITEYFALRQPIADYLAQVLREAKVNGYVETLFGRRRPTPDISAHNFQVRAAAERAAQNMPIQGTEADLMKKAMIELDAALGDLGDQILQVHDSILVECPAKNAGQVAKILTDIMQSVAPKLKIKLAVDTSTGANWGEL